MTVDGAGLGPRLAGKVAFITGAGMGMGREAAVLFAEHGARIGVADINKAAAEETVALVERAGGQAVAVAGDVAVEADVQRMIDETAHASARSMSSTTTRASSGRTATARCWRPTTAGGNE